MGEALERAPREDARLAGDDGSGVVIAAPGDLGVDVAWAPLPGSQELFVTCPITEALYEGTRGPGKTESLLMCYGRHVGLGYGDYWRGIIFRQTYKQLSDLVVKSQRLFFAVFPGSRFNKSSYTWFFPDGEQLLLRQAVNEVDYWDFHGHEYPFQGHEELTTWRDLKFYDAMKSCLRSSNRRVPRMIRSTTNPFGVGHRAVKSRFITPAPRGRIIRDEHGLERIAIHGSVLENPYLLQSDPDYIRRLDAIEDPNVRAAWRDGSWDINAGGAIDDLWNERTHMIRPFRIPDRWRITRSFDWGSARPFSLGWWATSNGEAAQLQDGTWRTFPPGTKFRIAEKYGSNGRENEGLRWTNRDIARAAFEIEQRHVPDGWGERVQPGGADSSIYETGNGFEQTIAQQMESERIVFVPAPKGPGSRRRRLELLRSALRESSRFPMEKPGLFAFDGCREYRRQLPELPRDPDDYECVDTGGEDHLFDELTYELTVSAQLTKAFNIRL